MQSVESEHGPPLTLKDLSPRYLVAFRDEIERCAASSMATAAVQVSGVIDRASMNDLGDQLASALRIARDNARKLVEAHQVHFPASPLFCSCTLLRPLGQSRRELSVTQVLGWLFDPNGEHGFGATLLRAFLEILTHESEAAARILEREDSHISVYTEFALNGVNRADLVIASQGHAIVVEAKVDANEGVTQTVRYRRDFEKSFPVCSFVYLTPRGLQATSDDFGAMRYLELARALLGALSGCVSAEGFHYARYFVAGLLRDLCEVRTSSNIDEVLAGNSFKLEVLLENTNE